MPAETPSGNHRNEQGSSPGRAPAVGVVGPEAAARRLLAILERDGLVATDASQARDPDVLVLAAESLTSAKAGVLRARDTHPAARIVLVLGAASPAEARQLLVDDVPGLVLEPQAEETLAIAARAAHAGQISYPAELMPTQLRNALSTREKQILAMVVLGFSNAEIALKLHVSQSTVKSHLYSAFGTIGVRSRKDAVALILDPNAGFGPGILTITDSAQTTSLGS